jgi:hypothetical protein
VAVIAPTTIVDAEIFVDNVNILLAAIPWSIIL